MNNELTEQTKKFIQEVCIDTWQMSKKEIKDYCAMIVKQNTIFAQFNKDYEKTAEVYAKFAGI